MSKRIITLGTWDGKPIEWIVLKEESFGTLVISRYALFSAILKLSGTWRSSNLRSYLNGEFYSKAFTEDEKKRILNSFLEKPEGTKDDVFLLSQEEATAFMTTNERKLGDGRCHGGCSGCYMNCHTYGTCWYLRTTTGSDYMYFTRHDGDSNCVGDNYKSIRPAMWIKEK